MLLQDMQKVQPSIISPPKWLPDNCVYLTVMGSQAYGVSSPESDYDLYGVCMPPKGILFPHTTGAIPGFGPPEDHPRFSQWNEPHIQYAGKSYDLTIYGINRYFQLCIENNPNMLDSLFTPRDCVLHSTTIGEIIRASREKFLHKGLYKTFMGYSRSQWAKIKSGTNSSNPSRKESIKTHGFDTKFAYHLVRLQLECKQFLAFGTCDLRGFQDVLLSIRRGEWTLDTLETHMTSIEKELTQLYEKSTLPVSAPYSVIKNILFECLEIHYGSLSKIMNTGSGSKAEQTIAQIENIILNYNKNV